ncbi:hypothetical protein EC973_007084 [Apophysomyces ossiformis]|uniref:Uncharacterized protein n=1 Tax=Apophysomyces ossiformis TaxID=679940 RepID=A0A8H7BVI7_9FUNG|nr:hypothetical protein EC973_007084 [Apophysomyces ossiformis]
MDRTNSLCFFTDFKSSESSQATSAKKPAGLGLSKEPPQEQNRPKLALSDSTSSGRSAANVTENKPTVALKNHNKWAASTKGTSNESQPDADKAAATKSTASGTSVKKAALRIGDQKPRTNTAAAGTPLTKKNNPTYFNIHEIYEKIHQESRMREKEKQEELERHARNEKLRLERDMQTWREHEERRREFTKWAQAKKDKDRRKRELELQKKPVDISKQKMAFQQFESTVLARDSDFRELYAWHRDTNDYRHMPVPGFVRRSRISLTELRRKFLSARVRIENVKLQREGNVEEGEADMDVE